MMMNSIVSVDRSDEKRIDMMVDNFDYLGEGVFYNEGIFVRVDGDKRDKDELKRYKNCLIDLGVFDKILEISELTTFYDQPIQYSMKCVYLIKFENTVKVGVSKNPKQRVKSVISGSGREPNKFYVSLPCSNYLELENKILNAYGKNKRNYEFIKGDCFKECINNLKSLEKRYDDVKIIDGSINVINNYQTRAMMYGINGRDSKTNADYIPFLSETYKDSKNIYGFVSPIYLDIIFNIIFDKGHKVVRYEMWRDGYDSLKEYSSEEDQRLYISFFELVVNFLKLDYSFDEVKKSLEKIYGSYMNSPVRNSGIKKGSIQILENLEELGVKEEAIDEYFGRGINNYLVDSVCMEVGASLDKINSIINNNLDCFKEGVDILNLKNKNISKDLYGDDFITPRQMFEFDNIYLLSRRGVNVLIEILKDIDIKLSDQIYNIVYKKYE